MKAKEYLRQIKKNEEQIRQLENQLESVKLSMEEVSSVAADRVRTKSAKADPVVNQIVKLNAIAEDVIKRKVKYEAAKDRMIREIHSLSDATYVAILSMRYIEGRTIQEIADALNYSVDRIKHKHGEALEAFNNAVLRKKQS